MFDDISRMMTTCVEHFRGEVHDSFSASIITEVLDPILEEIDSLRVFNAEFHRQAFNIERVLEEARSLQIKDDRCVR